MEQLTVEQRKVAEAALARCGPVGQWLVPQGYPDSLALCVIDAVQSVGVKYGGVVKVVDRYRSLRGRHVANTDGAKDLLRVFEELGVEGFVDRVGTRNRVSTRAGAALKAEVMRQAAELLVGHGVEATAQLRDRADDAALKSAWLRLPGQRSGITWRYALMLAQAPGVKPDRMVRRFVAGALDEQEASLTGAELVALVEGAAEHLGVSATVLDHAIWRAASGRGDTPSSR